MPTCSMANGCAARTAARTRAPQLRTAHEMLDAMGMTAFAERARRELLATGRDGAQARASRRSTCSPRRRRTSPSWPVTGTTNPEIGAQLFLSARTVEWHLRKVFTKLGISSRRDLRGALANLGRGMRKRSPHPARISGRRSGRRRRAGSRR